MDNPNIQHKLMEAAITLIFQSNYSDISVTEICRNAGVTKGSFYYYFETKSELFYKASEYYWREVKLELDEFFSTDAAPSELLNNMVNYVLAKQEQSAECTGGPVKGCPFFMFGSQAGVCDELISRAAREITDNAVQYHVDLASRLKIQGMLNGDSDPEQIGLLMHQFMQGLLIYASNYNDFEIVRTNLYAGLCNILDLKKEFRN